MKEGWTYKKLGEVVTQISDGDWIESKDQSLSGFRLIQTGNIGNGIFKPKEDRPHFISESTFTELGCTEVLAGDCIVSRLPDPIGRACIIPDVGYRMITAVDCTILRFNPSMVCPEFFVYYSQDKQYQREINKKTTGTTRKRISRKNLENIPIPLPPLSEQERIVSELDLLTEIIDKQKAQLKELDTLAQSIFYDMFGDPVLNDKGWPAKKLGEVGVFERGGNFIKSDFAERGTPCLHYGQIHTKLGAATYHHLTCLNEEKVGKAKFASKGDLIIAITSEDVEGSCKCTAWMGDYSIAVGSHIAIYKHNFNPIFISYYFRSNKFNLEKAKYVHGFKVSEIKPKDIAEISVPLPPLSLQQSFADKVSAIEQQKAAIGRSIAETQQLFDYTMDKYFG